MCGSKPLLGLMLRVGIGPDYLPNRELGLLYGRITLDRFLVGLEFEPFRANRHLAFLHSIASVSFQALCLQIGALFPSSLFPSVAGQLQILS